MVPTNPSNFDDKCPSLGTFTGLRVEHLNKRLPFHWFLEKVYYHAVIRYKDGGDLHPLFFNFVDSLDSLVTKHCPIKPESNVSDNISVDEVDMPIYKEEVKQFVQVKMNLYRNIEGLYGLI